MQGCELIARTEGTAMDLREGTRRLALLLGAVGAILAEWFHIHNCNP